MGRWRRRLAATACLLLVAICGSTTQPATSVHTHSVIIEDLKFTPENLTVNRGDKIVWVNKDLFPHTVTATDRSFDSGSIEVNGEWAYVAAKPGKYAYACSFHPNMKGSLQVQN